MYKKIAVGTNLFGSNKAQDLALQSLIKCKQKYPDNIDLYNIQFENGKDLTEHSEFKTLRCLKRTSKDVCNGTRELPIVRDMFDGLAELEYDYFCYINSDIMVSQNFFKEIFENDHTAYIGSRLAIEGEINDLTFSIKLNDPMSSPVKNSHYQVSGFDTFTIKTDWWKRNRNLFPEYVYAVVYWDTHYATLLLKNADTYMQNKTPTLFHIIHEDRSSAQCPEFTYNQSTFAEKHNQDFIDWHKYFFEVLVRRGEHNNFLYPAVNEVELQRLYFKI